MARFKPVTFNNENDLKIALIKRGRSVLGFRGIPSFRDEPLNGNAIQHSIRMVLSRATKVQQDGVVVYQVNDDDVAEYARHIASETIYWSGL